MQMKVNQRVQTPLGLATVRGFESFDKQGKSNPLSSTDTGGRVACSLDEPGNWSLSSTGAVPYFYRSQMSAAS